MDAARKLDPSKESNRELKAEVLAPSDIEFLRTTNLLKDVDESLISTVASFFEKVFLEQGEPVILENEGSDHVYFIKSGGVEILKYLPQVKQVQRLALLRAPAHFAEFSVLKQGSKGGSAFAVDNCELLRIKGEHFLALLRQIPEVGPRLSTHIASILDGNMRRESIEFFEPRLIKPTRELGVLLPSPLWKKFGVLPLSLEQNLLRVAMLDPFQQGFMEALRASNPQLVVCAYLISQAEFDVQSKKLTLQFANQNFGDNKKVVDKEPILDLPQLLERSTFFSSLPQETVASLIPHFQPMNLQVGEAVVTPQTASEFLYVVQSGCIEFARVITGSSVLMALQRVTGGGHFGEETMILGKNPCGYGLATQPTILYRLPADILMPLLADPEVCRGICSSMIEKLNHRSSRPVIKYFSGQPTFPGHLPLGVMTDQKVIDLMETDEEVSVGFVNADLETAYAASGRYLIGKRVKLELLREADYKKFLAQVQGPALAKNDPRSSAGAAPGSPLANAYPGAGGGSGRAAPGAPARPGGAPPPGAEANINGQLEKILEYGYNNRASDVHFEPGEHGLTVRFRVDGVLKEHSEKILGQSGKEMISRLKIMSGMDISNHFTPQDGQLKITVAGEQAIARASSIPSKLGEKIVLRLIRAKNSIIPYNMISPDRRLINILREVVNARQGLFLITGPTGSGKSTTMYSLLNELNRVDSNCVTLEDPVEMNIPGITQVEMNEKQGLNFARALRSVLRQDPDVIMVGEVRDEESAEIVFKAAITGHLVLSTLHTNSSLDVTPRLRELKVSPSTIATALIGVLAQRLVRAICRECKELRPIKVNEIHTLREAFPDVQLPDQVFEGKGCDKCNHTGYYDRLPVYEIWKKNSTIKNVLSKDGGYDDLNEAARSDGFVTMMEFGLKLALSGLTTVDEVLRCISE